MSLKGSRVKHGVGWGEKVGGCNYILIKKLRESIKNKKKYVHHP